MIPPCKADMTKQLETERLILRPLTVDDAVEIHDYFSDPAVYEHIPPNHSTSLEETREKLKKILKMGAESGYGSLAVIEKATGKIVGDCGIFPSSVDDSKIEIAYRFARPSWGKGFAVEAAQEVLRYSFETYGFDSIIAITGPDHAASIRVMEKLRMKHTGNMKDEYGEVVVYEITKANFFNYEQEAH